MLIPFHTDRNTPILEKANHVFTHGLSFRQFKYLSTRIERDNAGRGTIETF